MERVEVYYAELIFADCFATTKTFWRIEIVLLNSLTCVLKYCANDSAFDGPNSTILSRNRFIINKIPIKQVIRQGEAILFKLFTLALEDMFKELTV